LDGGSRIFFGSNPATNRQRQEDLARDGVNRARHRLTLLDRRGDVQNHHLVDAFDVVAARQLTGIAGVAELLELNAFHDLAIANIQTRDDAFGQHQPCPPARAISRKLRRICNPASLDFSGWNCTPKMLSRSTAAANVFACVVAAMHSDVTGAAYEC